MYRRPEIYHVLAMLSVVIKKPRVQFDATDIFLELFECEITPAVDIVVETEQKNYESRNGPVPWYQ